MFYILSIVFIVVVIGLTVVASSKRRNSNASAEKDDEPQLAATDCCGAHEVCEFDSYKFNEEEIVYFDDEELDALRNIREDQLTGQQIDQLREVLYTLHPQEINKWLISLGRRHIHLPPILQQEARQLLVEKH